MKMQKDDSTTTVGGGNTGGVTEWDRELERWRDEFSYIRSGRIHMANCSQAPVPDRVRDGLNRYLLQLTERGMDWDAWLGEVEAAKAEFARLINAEPDEIAVATSASGALASAASALDFDGPRNKVVTTTLDFPTVPSIWHGFERYGARLEIVNTDGDGTATDWSAIDDTTRVVSVAHANFETGQLHDIRAIGERAREKGAIMLVDAYQSAGVVPIDVKQLPVDILVTGMSKYLLGIPGAGFLYVRRELAEQMMPAIAGWMGQTDPFRFPADGLDFASGSRRFEVGTPPVAAAFAARAALQLMNEVGVERIARHGRMLSAHAMATADELGLKLTGPRDPHWKTPLIAVNTDPVDPGAVAAELLTRGIVTAPRGRVLRVAPHFFNTPEEVGHVLETIAEITARHGAAGAAS